MNNQVLLAYIDFLGFADYVKTSKNASDFKNQLEGVFESVKLQFKKIPRSKHKEIHPVSDYVDLVLDNLEFMMLSDSLVLWIDVNKSVDGYKFPGMTFESSKQKAQWDRGITDTIYRYFLQNVSMTAFMLMSETHLLLRGGIADGDFYSSEFKSIRGEFLFSQALNEAVALERRAGMPRVLVSDKICSRIRKSVWVDQTLIWTDVDGENALDVYHYPKFFAGTNLIQGCFKGHLKTSNKDFFFNCIDEKLKELEGQKEMNRRVWNKWHWFKEYHNKRMREIDSRWVI